jgi:hypothetical protein
MPETHLRSVPQPMSIEKHLCPQCHGRTTLTSIEPESLGIDRRMFECGKCKHVETLLVKFH